MDFIFNANGFLLRIMLRYAMEKKSTKLVRNEYEILEEYAPGVILILNDYVEQRKVAWLCKTHLDNLNPATLTRIAGGVRPLSPFVVKKLLLSGVVTINDLLEERSFDEIPDDHKILLMRLLMSNEFILKLAAFPSLADLEKIIDRALKKVKKKHPKTKSKTLLQSLKAITQSEDK